MSRGAGNLGPIGSRLGYQLRRVDMMVLEHLSDVLSQLGLAPGRATALAFIGEQSGCDQMALGRFLGINRASTMEAVNSLVALGAVERRAGRDRRCNALHLTDEGRRLKAEVEAITLEHDQTFFGVLEEDERAELQRLLVKTRNLNGAAVSRRREASGTVTGRVK